MTNTLKKALRLSALLVAAGVVLAGAAFALGVSPVHVVESGELNAAGFVFGGTTGMVQGLSSSFEADNGCTLVSAEDVKSIDLIWIAGSADVLISDDIDEISLTETSDRALTEKTALQTGVKNGTLTIQYCANGLSLDLPEKQLTLVLPRALAENLEGFSFDGSSAALTLSGISARTLTLSGVSGAIDVENLTAGEVRLNNTSGETAFSGSYNTLHAESTSGNISVIATGAASKTELSTTSGDLEISGATGETELDSVSGRISGLSGLNASEIDAESTSGEVQLCLTACPGKLEIETTSGDVTLALPADGDYRISLDSVSGELACDGLPLTLRGNSLICGNGTAEYSVETTSGDLTVKAADEASGAGRS